MRRRALVPIVLLALAACGDDGGGDGEASEAGERPCFGATTVPVAETTAAPTTGANGGNAPGTGAPGTTGAPTGTTAAQTPATSGTGTQPPPTGTAATETTGEGAGPAGIARPGVASPDDEGPDDSAVDVELEPVTGDTTPPTTVAPKPEVSLPEEPPTDGIEVTDIEDGDGPEARNGDYVEVRYVGVSMNDGEEFDSNYDQDSPLAVTVGSGQVIQGFDEGLVGMRAGGIRQIDIPADLAYGDGSEGDGGEGGPVATTQPPQGEGPVVPTEDTGSPAITESAAEGIASPGTTAEDGDDATSPEGTSPGSTPEGANEGPPQGPLSFVVEAERVVRRPDVQNIVEPSWCAPELVVDERREGSGDEGVEAGDTVRAHVVTLRGDNLFRIESTWDRGQPAEIPMVAELEQGGVAEGMIDGMEGMRPGGRRVITIPPDLAYGDEGLPQIGLPADKDFIVVVDLIEIL